MKARLFQFSTVVVGQAHNPTILNPDFLAGQGIVPSEWGWEVAETITTPPFAVVRFSNRVSITVEPNKLQVVDSDVGDDPVANKILYIASQYVTVLPHVRYTAVGVNFHSFVEAPSPSEHLKARFLKRGPWESKARPLTAAGFRLVYALEGGGQIVLSLDSGKTQWPGQEEKVPTIIANANFHRDCPHVPGKEDVIQHLGQTPSDWSAYRTLLCEVLDAEVQISDGMSR